jgi:hypothetical protein
LRLARQYARPVTQVCQPAAPSSSLSPYPLKLQAPVNSKLYDECRTTCGKLHFSLHFRRNYVTLRPVWPFKAKSREEPLRERVLELESDFRKLRIEWDELIESLERRAASARARDRHERDKIASTASPSEETPTDGLEATSGGRLLTPHQQQVQQQILKRRAGLQ